mmetsp:Transcript_20033/g.29415  ORF Transcript_20033/g.29415 Transcript_20033/m.29415 type:complete len:206 (-) Transcript_20033:103-720(-)
MIDLTVFAQSSASFLEYFSTGWTPRRGYRESIYASERNCSWWRSTGHASFEGIRPDICNTRSCAPFPFFSSSEIPQVRSITPLIANSHACCPSQTLFAHLSLSKLIFMPSPECIADCQYPSARCLSNSRGSAAGCVVARIPAFCSSAVCCRDTASASLIFSLSNSANHELVCSPLSYCHLDSASALSSLSWATSARIESSSRTRV